MMLKAWKRIGTHLDRRKKAAFLGDLQRRGFPAALVCPTTYLVTRRADAQTVRVSAAAEARRAEIAATPGEPIEIIYSPKPGSARNCERPAEGARLLFSYDRVAHTGKDAKWCTFLLLCARESRARTVVELGACAGISAYYLASAPSVERLVTVEGSAALADIARETLRPVADRADVHNGLFDDALDRLLPGLGEVDFAYIDGHHESVATMHYFRRMKPRLAKGAWVLFDDISWSSDMRDGWNAIVAMPGFSHCVDYGTVGVCLWSGEDTVGRVWDLRSISGHTAIGSPHGWGLDAGSVAD